MSTVLTAYQDGLYLGRCDKRCYNAKSKDCHCICGGRNHGRGEYIARLHAPEIIVAVKRELNRVPNQFGEVHVIAPIHAPTRTKSP